MKYRCNWKGLSINTEAGSTLEAGIRAAKDFATRGEVVDPFSIDVTPIIERRAAHEVWAKVDTNAALFADWYLDGSSVMVTDCDGLGYYSATVHAPLTDFDVVRVSVGKTKIMCTQRCYSSERVWTVDADLSAPRLSTYSGGVRQISMNPVTDDFIIIDNDNICYDTRGSRMLIDHRDTWTYDAQGHLWIVRLESDRSVTCINRSTNVEVRTPCMKGGRLQVGSTMSGIADDGYIWTVALDTAHILYTPTPPNEKLTGWVVSSDGTKVAMILPDCVLLSDGTELPYTGVKNAAWSPRADKLAILTYNGTLSVITF
jgi:hypothetical protein